MFRTSAGADRAGRWSDVGDRQNEDEHKPCGAFTFAGPNPANYVIEIVDAAGNIIGTSSVLALAAGATMTVTVDAAAIAAAAAAAGGGAAFFGSTLGVVTIIAAGAGMTDLIVAANRGTASPSQWQEDGVTPQASPPA